MSDKHHRYYKHTKFRQNPRGDPKFLVDLTWNDPLLFWPVTKCSLQIQVLVLEAQLSHFAAAIHLLCSTGYFMKPIE